MKKRMLLVVTSVSLILALIFLVNGSSSQEVLDPLKIAPDTHKLVFENRFVRVIESRVPAGGQEPKHSHPHGLTVYLANYESEVTTFPDGKVAKVRRQFGTAIWSDAVIHEVKNIGKTPGHALRIELKN
jgi:hypothetical protein